eukprot:gnl/TRDRNA2_/TRDRNA2_164553_c2_seq1.p1 gnl/TRDRNA2_/TRDRNA2_164553_c2~~gnl/TRDRNA2_/TRDRNA2_164553_c2_seq1.p1  ORF type:complete len:276 (+),score=56.33 gnl/TRDRNA2_/TRDRNA2_164553_c2_seq1:128-955(+)
MSTLDGRAQDGGLVVVKAGQEPPVFTCHFHNWDSERASRLPVWEANRSVTVEEGHGNNEAGHGHGHKEEGHGHKDEGHGHKHSGDCCEDHGHDGHGHKEGHGQGQGHAEGEAHKHSGDCCEDHGHDGHGHKEGHGHGHKEVPAAVPAVPKSEQVPVVKPTVAAPSPAKGASTDYLGHRSSDPQLLRQAAALDPKKMAAAAANDASDAQFAEPSLKSYSYDELKGSGNRPPNVDPTRKELYLSDIEFEKVFGQTKVDFVQLAKWKQTNLKKKFDLF